MCMYIICMYMYGIQNMKVKVTQPCQTLCNSMEFSRPECWSEQPFPSPGDLPNQGIKPRFPALQADSLPAEPPGKPNTGVSSLSLLQRILLTQESNQGLLYCRQILYQLSYQGSIEHIVYSIQDTATHSSILSWRIPMERGAWWVTVHGVAESDTSE